MDPFTLAIIGIVAFLAINRDSAGALMKAWHNDRAKGNNEIGWWGREIGGLFPHYRTEMGQGWRAHKTSIAQTKAKAAEQKTQQAPSYRQLRQQIIDHKRQMKAARQQPQPVPTGGRRHSQPASGQPVTTKRPLTLVPDQPAGSEEEWLNSESDAVQQAVNKLKQNGHDPMTCKDPDCSCHTGQGTQAPASPTGGAGTTNGTSGGTVTTSNGSGGTGDIDYEGAHKTIAQIIQDAEHAVSPATVRDASSLADGLPAMIPDDAQTFSHVADSVACLNQAAAKAAEAREHAEAAQKTLTKNFGDAHEAVQSSGHDAERGFHGVS